MGCDPEDILCKMTALAHLKGLKTALGEDRYLEEFPELRGLDEKLASRETSLKATLAECVREPEYPIIAAEITASEVTD